MPVEMGIWRIDRGQPVRLDRAAMPSEAALEDLIEKDPSLLGERLLIIGRQVRNAHGKVIDLLAVDSEGALHVLELKRDRTPRDVVGQVLDYGSWVEGLDREQVLEIAAAHFGEVPFEAAFMDTFGEPLPDELNLSHRLTVVAASLDPASERIVEYLSRFGVPVNVVFFSFLQDGDREYLARTWLVQPEDAPTGRTTTAQKGKKAEWEGDWYVSFGDDLGRSWTDALTYRFISAGGGDWYSGTLKNLPVGARVFVYIRNTGYVAVGHTTGPAVRFDEAVVEHHGQSVRLADLQLNAPYAHPDRPGEDTAEYVVPVDWVVAVPKEKAFWEKGMFANQNSACKLRQEFTLRRLREHFGLDDQA